MSVQSNELFSEETTENVPKLVHKPKMMGTKSKPFDIKESPMKNNSSKRIQNQMQFEENKTEQEATLRSAISQQNEKEMLSNTQVIEPRSQNFGSKSKENTRKSYNNLHALHKFNEKDKMGKQREQVKSFNPSDKEEKKEYSQKQMNNSSSQSSLGKIPGAIDLGNTKTQSIPSKVFVDKVEKKHETIVVEKQQKTKPLIGKKKTEASKKHETLNSFEEADGRNNTISANTIVNNRNQSPYIDRNEEEKVKYKTPNRPKMQEQKQAELENEDEEPEDNQEEFPVALNGLVFSFLPQEVANKLNDKIDWKKRVNALQETENLIKKQFSKPNEDFKFYVVDIWKKMSQLMHDSNFKISLTSLRIIHNLWMKYPKEMNEILPHIVQNLSNKLSDNKIVIRHAVLKVFHVLTVSLSAQEIVNNVCPFLNHENWHIREETLNVLMMAWITSNSTWSLSDPKMINQIWSMTTDPKDKVNQAAIEALWVILSKDSSTAIILHNYLDPQVYSLISEKCYSGKIASLNYDGIVEFPATQQTNNNKMLYSSAYAAKDPESMSMNLNSDNKLPMKNVDQTLYSQNFYKQQSMLEEKPRLSNFGQSNFDKGNITTNSVGNKMWFPGFNMTASSIKSEQSVRVSKEPVVHTPVQYTNKITSDQRKESISNTINKNLEHNLDNNQHKTRRFGNINNPSLTSNSLNVASTNMNSIQQTMAKTQMSQHEFNENSKSVLDHSRKTEYGLNDFNRKNKPMDYRSEKLIGSNDYQIPSKGPIKPIWFEGNSVQSSIRTESNQSGFSNFEGDSQLDSRENRYSQMSMHSTDNKNSSKSSLSQKKPPLKKAKMKGERHEKSHSIGARNYEAKSEKVLSPETQWKRLVSDMKSKNDWEKQFQACNIIKDFSLENKQFFKSTDLHFSEIMTELCNLSNSLRTQLSRNALGTFAVIFENLGKKIDCILESVIPMLLKKAADTNAFIAEEAEKALVKACENWSESKLVSASLLLSSTRVSGVKEKILVAINTIIEKLQAKFKTFKDREKVVSLLASGMNEAALEVRNAAKSGFLILKTSLSNRDFEKIIMRSTSERDYSKVIDFLEKESTSSDKFMETHGNSTKGTFYYNKSIASRASGSSVSGDYGDLESTGSKFSKIKSSVKKKNSSCSNYSKSSNFELISTEIMEKFQGIVKIFQDSDWKKRVSALKSLSNFIQEEDIVNKSKKFFQIIDVIVQCLKDNNTKVVMAAQDIFSNIMPNIRVHIEKGAAQIIEGLTSNVVSSNTMIKNWGRALMKKLVLSEELDWSVFIQPIWHQALQGKAKARSIILDVLWEVVEIVYEVKTLSVTKHIYRICSKLLDDISVKGDTKKSLYLLIGKLYELAGDSFVSSFPPQHTDKVWSILQSETNSVFST